MVTRSTVVLFVVGFIVLTFLWVMLLTAPEMFHAVLFVLIGIVTLQYTYNLIRVILEVAEVEDIPVLFSEQNVSLVRIFFNAVIICTFWYLYLGFSKSLAPKMLVFPIVMTVVLGTGIVLDYGKYKENKKTVVTGQSLVTNDKSEEK